MGERAVISLGSNIEPEWYLPQAVRALRELGRVLAVSAAYQNQAIGPTAQPDFLNAAVLLETSLSPHALRRELRRLETDLGRQRSADKYAPRAIDLDLLLFTSQVIQDGELRVPDPDLLRRAHLAVPAAEVAPDFVHPVTGENLATIAARLSSSARLVLHAEVTQQLRSLIARRPGTEA